MALSFSAAAKAELCRSLPAKPCCALAECFGILLYCNSFHPDGIRIVTESREFAAIVPKLFYRAFGVRFDEAPPPGAAGKLVFQIRQPEKLHKILSAFGFDGSRMLALQVNLPVVEEPCCRAAFFRGAFLAGGSVTDPAKGYHLEIATTHLSVARQTHTLLRETLDFPPKTASRNGAQVLYWKHSEQICDLLTYLGAPVAAMGILEAKLEKELKNKVNRRCNCDEANTSKQVEAAQEQMAAIQALRAAGLLEKLPEKLRQAAQAREENPSASLTELAAMMEPPITKPAMNSRMKKLTALAKEAAQ